MVLVSDGNGNDRQGHSYSLCLLVTLELLLGCLFGGRAGGRSEYLWNEERCMLRWRKFPAKTRYLRAFKIKI